MSKQSSLIKFKGKMDGISFYETKNGHFAKMAKGPSKDRIMTDPKFQRTRENLTEFSSMAIAGKLFRAALRPVSKMTDGELRLRLSKVFRAMVKRTDGIRGQRSVAISQNRELLRKLELNATSNFALNCPVRFAAVHSETRTVGTITVEPFNPAELITAGANITHFRLVQLIGSLPDVVFQTESNRYESADSFYDGLNEVTFSDYISINSTAPVTITLETALAGAPPPGGNVSIVQGLGVIFYELIGPVHYPVTQGNGMQIVDVF